MPTFKSYTYTVRPVHAYEGWDQKKKKLTPMTFERGERGLNEILDNIANAMEAGGIDNFLWPQQIFANRKSFDNFIEELECYDDCYRITDQWWTALAHLIGYGDEEGFISCSEIAGTLYKEAFEHGKLDNFGKKKPVYRYTPEQCKAAFLIDTKNNSANFELLTQHEREANREIVDFGAYYDLDISREEYLQAKEDGKKELKEKNKKVATKKPPAKKAVAKKSTVKQADKVK